MQIVTTASYANAIHRINAFNSIRINAISVSAEYVNDNDVTLFSQHEFRPRVTVGVYNS